ncbi:MAG: helix-turn-helix domain-containing protein [Defluviitaleaceae bacterium]|nr:helix-turn-helix domain-containing protein [Defluviitaleaceae bacterium]
MRALDIEADKLYDDYYKFLSYPYYVKVKEMRKERNLFQRELGEMLGVGRRAVERWEGGKTTITRETWEKLKELKLL